MAKDVNDLSIENEKLLRKLEQAERKVGTSTGGSSEIQETSKRLKKREMECQALWDTIKDISAISNVGQIMSIMSKRALESKAKRKLGLE